MNWADLWNDYEINKSGTQVRNKITKMPLGLSYNDKYKIIVGIPENLTLSRENMWADVEPELKRMVILPRRFPWNRVISVVKIFNVSDLMMQAWRGYNDEKDHKAVQKQSERLRKLDH